MVHDQTPHRTMVHDARYEREDSCRRNREGAKHRRDRSGEPPMIIPAQSNCHPLQRDAIDPQNINTRQVEVEDGQTTISRSEAL